jgi:phage terminase small subunit
MALTARQERFVAEYLVDLNATQAATRAGYSAKTANEQGSRLLANVSVAEAVAARRAKVADKLEISQEWVIERLVENVDRAMQAVEVKDAKGNGTGEYKYDGGVANRALELVGKHLGMFIERSEVGKPGEFDDLNLDQKRERAVAIARQLGLNRLSPTAGSA